MPFQVEGQVVRSGEGPLTHSTLKRFVAGVLSHVPGELVRAGELPATVFPVADVRLLPCMSSQVGFQVTGLGVAFPTSRMVTSVIGKLPFKLFLFWVNRCCSWVNRQRRVLTYTSWPT